MTIDLSTSLSAKADRHLWGHFARHGAGITPPIFTRGEGVYLWDNTGKRYIDGLSGLFTCQVGHGRKELAQAAAKQAETLEFFPLWSYATEPAIELATRLAGYAHGYTFGGHPVSSAVALANLDILENEGLTNHVKTTAPAFRGTLERLLDLPIVGDVRGEGFFYGIELVKDKATKEVLDDELSEWLLRSFLSVELFEAGLYCRADDRGDSVIQLAPPLISDQAVFDEIEGILRGVLTRAWDQLQTRGDAWADVKP